MDMQNPAKPLFEYDGKISQLYRIFLSNLLLSIITLGIYRFWASTKTRRYVWSRLSFQGERFEYTGTGGELLIGFLLALALVLAVLFFGIVGSAFVARLTHHRGLALLGVLITYIVLLILLGSALFSAQRYRLSRTQWRGVHGGMHGSAWVYGAWVVLYLLCIVFTLGQLAPWAMVRLVERRVNASSLGQARFHFQGQASKLYLAFLGTFGAVLVLFVGVGVVGRGTFKAMALLNARHAGYPVTLPAGATPAGIWWTTIAYYLLLIVGCMLISSFYAAFVTRHITSRSTLGGQLRFGSTLSGSRLLRLRLTNVLIALVTLGLGYPIVLHRSLRLMADTLTADGGIDADTLRQNTDQAPSTGEGMLNVLDHGGAF
jgi:uncharacterized membrane protein YjgN (DUF898 family)